MSLTKEKLLLIGGLSAPDIASMPEDKYEAYCSELVAFIETFPLLEETLKNSLNDKKYDNFTKILSNVQDVLAKINANGLALSCRRLLEELNGQKYNIVEAHFTYLMAEISSLSIDIQMAQHNAPDAVTPVQTYQAREAEKKTILAADDVSLVLLGLRTILSHSEYKFTGVASGAAALRFVERYTPDLFILDIGMPEMDGYELARRLRQCGQKAPIIFLTGNASIEYVRKAMEVGAADFIVKPVNKEQVLEKIRKHI